MDADSGKRRITTLDRRSTTRLAIAAGTLLTIGALLAPGLVGSPPPSPSPSGGIAIGSPGARPDPSGAPGPSATPDPWSDLVFEPFEPLAELTSLDPDRLGFGRGSEFRLRSLTSTPAVALAAGLRTEPPLELRVEAGETDDVAIVRAAAPSAGTRYRFRLNATDGALLGTWVFRARGPLHVVTTLPGDLAVGVPPNTGIEVTFDQDGTVGVADRFSMEPAVAGRLEQHGRTWAFVPDEPLEPAVIYTVRVAAGVGVRDSVETLEQDVTFRFETGRPQDEQPLVTFGRQILEARPGTAVDIAIWMNDDDEENQPRMPDSVGVVAHRLPNFDAVVAAAETLAGPDGWAVASARAVVDTGSLTRVARVDARILETNAGWVLQVPTELDAGFYIMTIEQPGAPAQALLQVTNLSAYALAASRDMTVWVNDIRTGAAVPGASVAIARGKELGTTDGNGLYAGRTPDALLAVPRYDDDGNELQRAVPFITIAAPDGRRLLVAPGLPVAWTYAEYVDWYGGDASQNYWTAFFSDRDAYRQTDTVHVSGTIRARDDRSVPDSVEIRLRPYGEDEQVAIARVRVEPSERGVFTADIRLDRVPRAEYRLELLVGTERVATLWIRVTEIRKPAYRIEVQTDRHVYLAGMDIDVAAAATFYDGSAVPGMELRVEGFREELARTTSATGGVSATITARYSGRPSGFDYGWIAVAPANPEEGQISGEHWVMVLPSASWIEATGTVRDGRIVVTGTLSRVDLRALEAAVATDAELDPTGSPIAGGTVHAVVVHKIPVTRKVGTTYDFIEKRVVPIYEHRMRSEEVATTTLTTDADGGFRLSMPAPVAEHGYVIKLSTRDAEGRRFVNDVYADSHVGTPSYDRRPYLEGPHGCSFSRTLTADLGEAVDVTMHEADGSVVDDGRLLFLVASRGSMDATVQDAATFVRTLRDRDLPGFTVRAVWLSDGGYFVGDVDVVVDRDDKSITVTLHPDKSRYRPGDTVSLGVTTTDHDGRPIATDVVLQGVDEKLYTIGMASALDPIGALMAPTPAGFVAAYRSHAVPAEDLGGCGDTGGGGDRDDFRDSVTFQRMATDANGHGKATFRLSDDLTSWRITATAYSGNLDAGVGSVQVPVGLPFFVDAVLAPEYLVGDEAVLLVRGYGEALRRGDGVRFTVSAPTLGLAPVTVRADAFATARLPLPEMTPGNHQVRIEAETGSGDDVRRDVLIRTVHVVSSRLSALSSTFAPLAPGWQPTGGDGFTRFVVTDLGRGPLMGMFDELAGAQSARLDRRLAAELARTVLIEEYGIPAASLPSTGFEASAYAEYGLALLPYAAPDLFLTAKSALVAPGLVDVGGLREALREWERGDGATSTRERRIVALAGLAGLGEDVADELQAVKSNDLTVIEQAWLALGLAATGDEPAARAMEAQLLEEHGQRLGPWVRLVGPTAVQSQEASALLLLLAARLGDPLSADVARYLADNPSAEQVFPLEQVGYGLAMLERLPKNPARFAWTLDGQRHEETLKAGGSWAVLLTRSQWTGLELEPLEGELGVAATFESDQVALPHSPDVSIQRVVTPDGSSSATEMVRVQIRVQFGGQLPTSCYRLTDLVPSGLAPVARVAGWYEEEDGYYNGPWQLEGHRVSWCASPEDDVKVYEYSARVVTPGTYRWEPAVLQWEEGPELGTSTLPTTYVIR